ncbi:triphosphoribosyl-dephospho-CoA synthase CitG [Anaerosolibacter sp.]|uniref:triphosphoribosyl-dephospho-CoA synthase CitG n=1 Tax=Anaerosolibacter sp. TaxID=1872527 RepID=UPI00260352D9|nr:triphosphoribosyl-dephospho-CoA synthase CitG [Anaerosolibacter sp.]
MDENLIRWISQQALLSLLYEVSASPKPGLVDRFNQGAHKDMNFFTFMASSSSLVYFFHDCAAKGVEYADKKPIELFKDLRGLGMEAEKTMFDATGGVNTHKGLIFSLGIISAAAACCVKEKGGNRINTDEICAKVSRMTHGLCKRELDSLNKTEGFTHGETLFNKYGYRGIRGEVESGFQTVRSCSLPTLKLLKAQRSYSMNDIFVQTLLHLMTVNEDTNIAARHSDKTLMYVQQYAKLVLAAGGILTEKGAQMVNEMDRDFIEKNISPGGSADLLAVTIMLDRLSEMSISTN